MLALRGPVPCAAGSGRLVLFHHEPGSCSWSVKLSAPRSSAFRSAISSTCCPSAEGEHSVPDPNSCQEGSTPRPCRWRHALPPPACGLGGLVAHLRASSVLTVSSHSRANGNVMFFHATVSRTNGNFCDFLLNETIFLYFVAIYSRTNGDLTQKCLQPKLKCSRTYCTRISMY